MDHKFSVFQRVLVESCHPVCGCSDLLNAHYGHVYNYICSRAHSYYCMDEYIFEFSLGHRWVYKYRIRNAFASLGDAAVCPPLHCVGCSI